jgi:cysteinyl-tRNA synthetase
MNGRPGQRAGGSALAPFDGMAMELKLYDTLAREKRVFVPIDPHNVRMYVCGPTVYDFAHIGNARPAIVFDVLFRLLRHLYGADHVTYVRNVTDVDDKINARAAERGIPIRELTEETYANYKADVAALGCLPPTIEPRATEYIGRTDGSLDMISVIRRLLENGNAYVEKGHVLFHVPSMRDYGQLSKRSLDEMIAGARVEVAPYKRNPMDFVLWKPSVPPEPAWDSPWGFGRPGWHIECSAMSGALLGETFDVHGGGIDLMFPHHENEIAQSRCAFHTGVMANYWMHNGFLQVEGEKMSKSLGNFVTIKELLNDWPGEVLRLNMLRTHYRQPIDWTLQSLSVSAQITEDWRRLTPDDADIKNIDITPTGDVLAALLDDLNTPVAIHFMHEIAKARATSNVAVNKLYANLVFLGLLDDQIKVVRYIVENQANEDLETIFFSLRSTSNATATISAANTVLFGVEPAFVGPWKRFHPSYLSSQDAQRVKNIIGIDKLNEQIERRLKARREKNFKESDGIRDELAGLGIVLKDSKDGTTWELAR